MVSFGEYAWRRQAKPTPSAQPEMAQPLPLVASSRHPRTVHTREVAGSIPAAPIAKDLQILLMCLQIRHDSRSKLRLWQVLGKLGR